MQASVLTTTKQSNTKAIFIIGVLFSFLVLLPGLTEH